MADGDALDCLRKGAVRSELQPQAIFAVGFRLSPLSCNSSHKSSDLKPKETTQCSLADREIQFV